MAKVHFVKPPLVTIEGHYYPYCRKYRSYSEYNYLKGGIDSYLKLKHFECALKLTRQYFNKCNVIDFGCADGVFLPSLAKYYNHVAAIDNDQPRMKITSKLAKELKLDNVELICNDRLEIEDIKERVSDKKYQVLYLLETLEHVGTKERMYESKIDFLQDLFDLVEKEGVIVISVPVMVGLPFLLTRLVLGLFGMYREPISTANLFKASFLYNTNNLENGWKGEHLGFNHEKLERYLKKGFRILKRKDIFFQVVYMIGRVN